MAVLKLRNHIPISGPARREPTDGSEKIWAAMERIYRDLAPCDVVMVDIQADTRDSRVNELLDICRWLEG